METVTKPQEEQENKNDLADNYLVDAAANFMMMWMANNIFDKLPKQYWVLGCIFDSILDLFKLAVPKGFLTRDQFMDFLLETTQKYIKTQSQGVWYDDWCWWGNPAAKIFSHGYDQLFNAETMIVNPRDKKVHDNLLTICTDTFLFVKTGTEAYKPVDHNASYYTGTTDAYNNAVKLASGQTMASEWADLAKDCRPVWNVGCWQGPMIPKDIGGTQCDPRYAYPPEGSFQDSVMNGLFYIFVLRTLNKVGNKNAMLGTQKDVNDMTTFYSLWMNEGQPALTADQQLFMQLPDPDGLGRDFGLFRERVSIYSDGKTPPVGFNKDLAWTGDQGLMLSALTELYNIQSGDEQQKTYKLICAIINGVFGYAIGDVNEDHKGVIMPWFTLNPPTGKQPDDAPGGDDKNNYFSGTGIFMRGLLDALGIPDVRRLIKNDTNVKNVLSNTLAALRDGSVYVNFIFNNKKLTEENRFFDDFNKMATLITASQLL
jgi:hypothetical protein